MVVSDGWLAREFLSNRWSLALGEGSMEEAVVVAWSYLIKSEGQSSSPHPNHDLACHANIP